MIGMLLRSFSNMQVLTGEMLDTLFKDLKDYKGEFDYSLEIIDAALDGRIDISKKFSLFGYCKTVREGNFQTELKRLKKQQYIIDDDNDDETGVKVSSLVDTRSDYEIIDDKEELEYSIKKIRALNDELISTIGVDLIFCMRQALKGTHQAVQELASICEEYDFIAEYIQIILSSGVSFKELFLEEDEVYFPRVEENLIEKAG